MEGLRLESGFCLERPTKSHSTASSICAYIQVGLLMRVVQTYGCCGDVQRIT